MNQPSHSDAYLANVLVPRALVAHPGQFGGVITGDCLQGDLLVRDGRAFGLSAPENPASPPRMLLPKLTEAHVHLDKCHTVSRIGAVGGDLQAAMAAQSADKKNWTVSDIRARAERGLNELIKAGCNTIRTHVDWPTGRDAMTPPATWHVLKELAQDTRARANLQLSPLLGVQDMLVPEIAEATAKTVAQVSGALGCFVLDQPNRRAAIETAFRMAEKYNLALDFHVDEGLADGLDGLSMIADVALETGFQRPVLCGHASSLMNTSGTPLLQLLDKIAQSGLTVATLPTTNLYLQGRTAGTPDRRGITRIKELAAAGVPVVVGSDNVRDAFCPLGRHDPLASLALAALAAHLDPPLGDYLPMITTNAQRALGLAPAFVDRADIGDLLLFHTSSTPDLLAGDARPIAAAEALQGEPT